MNLFTIQNLIAIVCLSYLLGSVPTAIWVGKCFYKKDILQLGSGNAGATNVYRCLGWFPAIVVVLLDMLKGWVPVVIFPKTTWFWQHLNQEWHLHALFLAGLAAVLGHIFSLFAAFRGGKGVATSLGTLLGLFPLAVPLCVLVFFVTVWKTRYISLGSILGTMALPVSLFMFSLTRHQSLPRESLVFSLALTLIVILTHRSNLKRLLSRTEPKFSRSKSHPSLAKEKERLR